MQKAGIKHFRYSISWPRVLPQGTGAVTASVMHQCLPCKLTMLFQHLVISNNVYSLALCSPWQIPWDGMAA